VRLINYGSKIMDHTFILKGGTICVFFSWVSADSLFTLMLCKVCWYGGLGWGGADGTCCYADVTLMEHIATLPVRMLLPYVNIGFFCYADDVMLRIPCTYIFL